MKFSHKITTAVLTLSLLPMGLSVYADMGEDNRLENDEFSERRTAMMEALDNGDYDAWYELAGPQMQEVVTEENFDELVEAHNLMQEGDVEGAKAIFDELGMKGPQGPRGQGQGNGKGNFPPGHKMQMKEALDNADYDAWLEVAPEQMKEKINADNFDRLVVAHNLVQEGNFEEAQVIFDELGLERAGNMMERRGNGGAMKEALDNADYEAFLAVAPDHLKDVITQENFSRFVEAHELMQAGDKEGAKAIMDELGIQPPKPGNRMGKGMGQHMGQGMGQQ